MKAAKEDFGYSLLDAYPGQVRQRFPGDGEDFVLGVRSHGFVQRIELVVIGFLQFGVEQLRFLSSRGDELVPFGLGRVGGVGEEGDPLMIDLLVLVLEVGLFLEGFRLFIFRILKLGGDALFPCINGVEDGLVEEVLEQPDQDKKIDDLRGHREPVDEHGYFPTAWVMTWFQNGLAKIRIIEMTKQ